MLTRGYSMSAERDAAATEGLETKTKRVVKKRKRNPDPLVGHASRHFELVTAENVKRHKVRRHFLQRQTDTRQGWSLDTATATPLFSLICRPSHPLPLPPKAAPTAWTREAPKSKASKAARAILKASAGGMGVLGVKPITRSRRERIDVRRWGRRKTILDLEGSKIKKEGWWGASRGGEWECVDQDEGEGSASSSKVEEVQWIFRAKDGTVKRSETVKLTARSVGHTDSFAALLDLLEPAGPAATLPVAPIVPPVRTLPITFERPLTSATSPVVTVVRPRSLSPPVYVPIATKALMYNEEDTFALLTSTQGDHEIVESIAKERDVGMMLLKGLIGDDVARAERGTAARPTVEGFAEESDEEDVLRLRGGAGDEEESSDDESEEEVVAMEVVEQPKTTLKMGSLKDMFKPQESAGRSTAYLVTSADEPAIASFSILSSLELDLPPPSRTPSPEPFTYAAYPSAETSNAHASTSFVPPAALGAKNRSWIGTASVGSFFMYPSSGFNGEGVSEQRRDAAARETAERVKSANGFWRSESLFVPSLSFKSCTDLCNREKIEASHQKLREALRGQARKRHREAAKRVRRKGTNKRGTGGGGAMDDEA